MSLPLYEQYKSVAGANALPEDKFNTAMSTDRGKELFYKVYGGKIGLTKAVSNPQATKVNPDLPDAAEQTTVYKDIGIPGQLDNYYFELGAGIWKSVGALASTMENMRKSANNVIPGFSKLGTTATFQKIASHAMAEAKNMEQYGIDPKRAVGAKFVKDTVDIMGEGIGTAAQAVTFGIPGMMATQYAGAQEYKSLGEMSVNIAKGYAHGFLLNELMKPFAMLKPYLAETIQGGIFAVPSFAAEMAKAPEDRDWQRPLAEFVGGSLYGFATNPGVRYDNGQLGLRDLISNAKTLMGTENWNRLNRNAKETLRILDTSPTYDTPDQAAIAHNVRNNMNLRSDQAVVFKGDTGNIGMEVVSHPEGSRVPKVDDSFVYDWHEYNVPQIANRVFAEAENMRVEKKREYARKAAEQAGKEFNPNSIQPRPWGMNSYNEQFQTMAKVSEAMRSANGDWNKLPDVVKRAIQTIDQAAITPSETLRPMFDGSDGFQMLGGKVGKTDEPMRLRNGETVNEGTDWVGERYIKVKLPTVGSSKDVKAKKDYVIDLMGAAEMFLAGRNQNIRSMKRPAIEKVVEQLRKAYESGNPTPEMIRAAKALRREVYLNVNAQPDEIMVQRINVHGNPEPGITSREVSQLMLMRDLPVNTLFGKPVPTPFESPMYKAKKAGNWFYETVFKPMNESEGLAINETKTRSNEFYRLRDRLKKEGTGGNKLQWGWEDRIGAWLISKQQWTGKDGQIHTGKEILGDLGIKPPETLNAAELEMSEYMRANFDQIHKFINEQRGKAGLPEIPYMDNYFTVMSVMSQLDQQRIDLQSLPKASIGDYIRPDATPFPFKERQLTGGHNPIELNAERIFMRYMQTSLRHGHLAPHIAKQRAMMKEFKGRNGQTMFDLRDENPALFSEWDGWLNYITKGTRPTFEAEKTFGVAGRDVDRWLLRRQRGIVTSTLAYGIQAHLNQLATLKHAYVTEDINTFRTGITKYVRNLINQVREEGVLSYSKNELLRREHDVSQRSSAELMSIKTRAREADIIMRDLQALERQKGKQPKPRYEIPEKSMAGRWEKTKELAEHSKRLGFAAMSSIDGHVARAMWEVYYEGGLKRFKDHKRAVQYADELITSTAGSTLASDTPNIQRTVLGKMATTFQTFLIAEWNFTTHELTGRPGATTEYADTLNKVVKFAVATALINYFYEDVLGLFAPYPAPINHAIDAMEEGKDVAEVAGAVAGELLSAVPVVGPGFVMNSSTGGAVVSYFDDAAKAIGNGDIDKIPYLVARYYGVPGAGQARKIINHNRYNRKNDSKFPFDWNKQADFNFKQDSWYDTNFNNW